MSNFDFILYALFDLLRALPLLLVKIVGIVVALTRWQRHPRISLYTTVSLIISLALSIFSITFYRWMPLYLYSTFKLEAQQTAYVFMAINFVVDLISAVALALLLFAIFSERGGNANREPGNTIGL